MTKRENTRPSVKNRSLSSLVLISTVIAVPLIISPRAQDVFRFPKELLMRASAILLLVCAGIGVFRSKRAGLMANDFASPLTFVLVLAAWALITSLTSTNPVLSSLTMLWILSCTIFFVASQLTASQRTLPSIEWIAVPTAINVAVYAAQQLGIWRPFGLTPHESLRGSAALLGTPDDVAMFLVPASLAGFALSRSSERRRVFHLLVAISAAATVVWTQSLTGVAALATGFFVQTLLTVTRRRVAVILVVFVTAFVLPLGSAPFRQRVAATIRTAKAGDFDRMVAGRALPWAAAVEMVRAHPIVGVGPGCFSWQYFPFRRQAESKIPALLDVKLRHANFGEAHCDPLQLAATSGIPALAIFFVALWKLAKYSHTPSAIKSPFAGTDANPEGHFSRLLGAPLAIAVLILSAAQFPLELAAPMSIILFLSGAISGWSVRS